MENGETTFCGMSSVNEFWSRASETDRSEIKTSSSDDSADETESSGKEYRDASCYVDFEDEFNEIVYEDDTNIVENSKKIIKFNEFNTEENVELKPSRYVRWDVLMSLGLGLWAVLCIVDVIHSEKSVTRGWLFEFVREKKNVSKPVLVKRAKSDDSWLFHFWPYLWRFIWISSSGGASILIILLLIVFCADPRLRKAVGQATINNSLNTRVSPQELQNSIVKNKIYKRKKSQNSRAIRPIIRKIVTAKLVLSPAIYLHAKILASVEQRFSDSKTIQARNYVAKRRIANFATILQQSNRRPSECRKFFTVNQSLLDQFYVTSCRTLRASSINGKDADTVTKASASMCLMESSSTTCRVRKIHIEVEEYLRKTKKCSNAFDTLRIRSIEPKRNFTELSHNGNARTRIITSSAAFKNFLLRLKHNSCVS